MVSCSLNPRNQGFELHPWTSQTLVFIPDISFAALSRQIEDDILIFYLYQYHLVSHCFIFLTSFLLLHPAVLLLSEGSINETPVRPYCWMRETEWVKRSHQRFTEWNTLSSQLSSQPSGCFCILLLYVKKRRAKESRLHIDTEGFIHNHRWSWGSVALPQVWLNLAALWCQSVRRWTCCSICQAFQSAALIKDMKEEGWSCTF